MWHSQSRLKLYLLPRRFCDLKRFFLGHALCIGRKQTKWRLMMQMDALRGTDRRSQAGPESLKNVAAQLTQRFADLSSDISEQINAMRGGFRQGFSGRSHPRSGSGKPLQIDCFNFGHWAGDKKSPMFAGALDRPKPQWLKGQQTKYCTLRSQQNFGTRNIVTISSPTLLVGIGGIDSISTKRKTRRHA